MMNEIFETEKCKKINFSMSKKKSNNKHSSYSSYNKLVLQDMKRLINEYPYFVTHKLNP